MKMRQFLVYPYPQEVGLAPSWAAGVIRDEKNEKMVPTEAVGCMLAATGKAKWKSRMSTSVLRGIILLLGGVICVLSTYGVFAPFKLTNWVRSAWGKKSTFPFAVIVRLVMGPILIFAAPESRSPVFFEVLGWLFIVAAFVILGSGRDRTGRMLNWFEGLPAWAISLWCLLGIFLGGFLIYGVW